MGVRLLLKICLTWVWAAETLREGAVISKTVLTQGGMALFGIVLGLFLGKLAISGVELGKVAEAIDGWSMAVVPAAVLVVLLSSYLRGVRWSLLWTERRVSALRLMVVENAALGLNNISPVRFLDEGVELGILTLRDRLPGSSVVATMMMCRIQDLAVTLVFIAMAVAILPELWSFTPVLAATVLFLGGWLVVLVTFDRVVRRFPLLQRIPGLLNFEAAVSALWKQKSRLVVTLSMTLAYWLLLGPVGMLVAQGTQVHLPFHVLLVTVLGALMFSTALPGLPGAVGTFEFAVVTMLGLWDIPKDQALSFAIVLHAVLFLPMTVFTVVVLPREGLGSIRALRGILRHRQTTAAGPPSP
uniref:Uncharacterized protein family (UPF0104) n=1 Tax=uncultured marine microorganism HF4000_APKG7H23 TaxID=455551 RepID=B3T9V3_9ZZZZ|nr:putative uncharacterized protein family (UPF0104) [uncultured marine microorganism HF4000_APKG7H23]